MGPVQVVGEDDHYPKTVQGDPVDPPKFIIRAEKCPNRLGVEEILQHFQGEVISQDQVFERIKAGETEALYYIGGDPFTPLAAEHTGHVGKTLAAHRGGHSRNGTEPKSPLRFARRFFRRERRHVHQPRWFGPGHSADDSRSRGSPTRWPDLVGAFGPGGIVPRRQFAPGDWRGCSRTKGPSPGRFGRAWNVSLRERRGFLKRWQWPTAGKRGRQTGNRPETHTT